MKKLIICLLIIININLLYKLFFKPDGVQGIIKIKQQINQQKAELANLQLRNGQLLNSVILIKDNPQAIEEHARVVFGMIKKDETYYRIIE